MNLINFGTDTITKEKMAICISAKNLTDLSYSKTLPISIHACGYMFITFINCNKNKPPHNELLHAVHNVLMFVKII